MPVYAYECSTCGGFEARRDLAEFDKPAPCPGCGGEAPRGLTVPQMAVMSADTRQAHAVNERSANAPKASHGGSCQCCKPSRIGPKSAFKASPSARPWMISH